MTERASILFENGVPTVALRRIWVRKGALQPLMPLAIMLEEDRSGNRQFRGLWARALPPPHPSLPFGPLVDKAGRGTDEFWRVLT